jgi:hypothetical protein
MNLLWPVIRPDMLDALRMQPRFFSFLVLFSKTFSRDVLNAIFAFMPLAGSRPFLRVLRASPSLLPRPSINEDDIQ